MILFIHKIYGKKDIQGIEELYKKLWRMLGKKDLSTIETCLESYFKNNSAVNRSFASLENEGTVKDMERTSLEQLIKGDYTVQQICHRLGISRSSFYRKIEEYKLAYKKRRG